MRITKVYTKSGDKGTTALVGGQRVPKNHIRIVSYGSVDELNTILGLALSFLPQVHLSQYETEKKTFTKDIKRIQNHLFNIGADLATPKEHRWENMIRVGDKDVSWLEEKIDEMNAMLPPLTEFILPGGTPVEAFLHQARTVCRRAERNVFTLIQEQDVDDGPMIYLNRLSDYLFVAGRWIGQLAGTTETTWQR